LRKYIIIALLIILSGCTFGKGTPNGQVQSTNDGKKMDGTSQKKVVMVLVDSMTAEVIDKGIKKNVLPAFEFLIKNGQYHKELIAPFPTMSATAESTIMTGEMPHRHKVPGIAWYDAQEDRIVNYGSSPMTMFKLGLSQGVDDILYNLNNTHLSKEVKTIHEELDDKKFTSTAINTLIYRGNKTHQLEMPFLTNKVLELPEEIDTKGPHILGFGRLAIPEKLENKHQLPDGIFNSLGIDDQYSMEVTKRLIKQGDQTDFLITFFPQFDKNAHKHGPEYVEGLEKVDQKLQEILNAYGSWDEAIRKNIFIILGDHGVEKMGEDEKKVYISLDDLYKDYDISALGQPVSHGDIAFGVNQRMTYIYDVQNQGLLPMLAEKSTMDNRISFAAWLEDGWVQVIAPNQSSILSYKLGGDWRDQYMQEFSLRGDPTILGLKVDHSQKSISYTNIPDALNRLYSALKSHKQEVPMLILAARPKYSFVSETIPIHPGGGDHGGIHEKESLAAMIITGTDEKPRDLRMTELKEYITNLIANN
jgi:predicted AlkP superfamily pyrophosphatase or phosphodiesterase